MKAIAILGAVLGLTSVIMGAASDHFFAEFITPENAQRLDVALRYHQLYSVLIFCLGLYSLNAHCKPVLKWAGYIFCAGTVLFCGSLYISLFPGFEKATYITPVGGVVLMLGWVLSLFSIRHFQLRF